jgi:hypothetical protein
VLHSEDGEAMARHSRDGDMWRRRVAAACQDRRRKKVETNRQRARERREKGSHDVLINP